MFCRIQTDFQLSLQFSEQQVCGSQEEFRRLSENASSGHHTLQLMVHPHSLDSPGLLPRQAGVVLLGRTPCGVWALELCEEKRPSEWILGSASSVQCQT